MKTIKLLLLCLFTCSALFAQENKDFTERSIKIYEWVRTGEFGKVLLEFDSTMAARIDSVKLAKAWVNLVQRVGGFVKVTDTVIEYDANNVIFIQKSVFEKKVVDFKLVYGSNGKVKGIFFKPADMHKYSFDYPDYRDSINTHEKRLFVTTGPYRLPGILTSPRDVRRPPVAILVHGSGPNDKDETVGSTKIFRDLALGLTAQGIAVLRYDKRTRNYGKRMKEDLNTITVKEETMDDVLSAIRILKKDSTIDSTRIYLIGHSLGGMLLPRIAGQTKDVKGIILLAANARPIQELMLEQTEYLSANDSASEVSKEDLDSMKNMVNKINSLTTADLKDTIGVFSISNSYWLDLNKYDQVSTAAKLKLPMLILHGDRDYQVTAQDFSLWKSGLKTSKYAKFKSYPDANHFFISGIGKSLPGEYDQPGNVEKQVIDDISSFILKGEVK